jgi:hypothetical protein
LTWLRPARRGALAALLAITAIAPGATAEIVPVFCARAAAAGAENPFTCRRADTRASFASVPAGMYLHIMNVHAVPNTTSTAGAFAGLVGRDDADLFPTFPSVAVTGGATSVNALRLRVPAVVLHEGETLSLSNFAHSDFAVDAHASGFLSPVVRAPEPSSLGTALAAGAVLGAFGAWRAR